MADRGPSDAEPWLESVIEAVGRRESARLKQHPSDQQLLDYQAGRLDDSEEAALSSHLAVCRECADDLLELTDWDERLAAVEERSAVPVGERGGRRVADDFGHGETKRQRTGRWSGGVPALLAAAIAVVALGLGFWLGQLDRTRGSAPGLGQPIFADLVPEGATRLRESENPAFSIPPGPEPFFLRLNLGDQTPYRDYRLDLLSEADEPLRSLVGMRRHPTGAFTVLVARRGLPAGRYRLRLVGVDGESEATLAHYPIELEAALPE